VDQFNAFIGFLVGTLESLLAGAGCHRGLAVSAVSRLAAGSVSVLSVGRWLCGLFAVIAGRVVGAVGAVAAGVLLLGCVGALPGQLFAFLVGLLCASGSAVVAALRVLRGFAVSTGCLTSMARWLRSAVAEWAGWVGALRIHAAVSGVLSAVRVIRGLAAWLASVVRLLRSSGYSLCRLLGSLVSCPAVSGSLRLLAACVGSCCRWASAVVAGLRSGSA
jgi:hypothetical protein